MEDTGTWLPFLSSVEGGGKFHAMWKSHHETRTTNIYIYIHVPVVPHKAVAEVSRIGHCRRGELL